MSEVRESYTDCATRLITWQIPDGLDSSEVELAVTQVCGQVAEKVMWLRGFRLFPGGDGAMFLEATITGKHQWMVHRRGRSLALKLVRRLGVMLTEPDVCRLPEHPNRRTASAAASKARWGTLKGSPRRTTR